MKLTKLTALLLLTGFTFSISSCESDAELKRVSEYAKTGITLSGAQETPANTSAALGTLDVFYTRASKVLTYTINWSGLSGPVTAAHIHGLAPTGYLAGVVQTFTLANITRCATVSTTTCGTYKGSLLVDEVVVKENDLINGVYYVNLHTAAFPAGEIRAQIKFQ